MYIASVILSKSSCFDLSKFISIKNFLLYFHTIVYKRISKTDQYGKLSNGLTYRFHNKIDTLSHANITQLSRIEFDRIFKTYDSLSDKEKCDFFI